MIFHNQKFKIYRRIHLFGHNLNIDNSKQQDEIQNINNQKILDCILDDDDEQLTQLLTESVTDLSQINKTFKITNYKVPEFLEDNPSYASLCACFSAEKCFTAITMLLPDGITSKEISKVDDFKRSPIHFACIGGSLNIIRELENSGINLNLTDNENYLPSHYAAMAGHFDVIKYLWTKGADVLSYSSIVYSCLRPIQIACLYGNLDIVKFLCDTVIPMKQDKDDEKNIQNYLMSLNDMKTPLHYACIGGHDNIVKYFISKPEYTRVQINVLDNKSRTPLLCACHNGSLECVKAILSCEKGKTNLSMKGRRHLPLVDAAEAGHLDVVQYLVKQKGINIQQETSFCVSALNVAIINDHFEIVKFLIEQGAAKNFDDKKIGQIVMDAFDTGNIQLVRYLDSVLNVPYHMNSQVMYPMNLNAAMTYGDKYMQIACNLEQKELVEFLLEKKCNFNSIDASIIIQDQSFNFFDFLIEKGFNVIDKNKSNGKPLIVTMIRYGNLQEVKKLISRGVALNKEIITNYQCIILSCYNCDLQLFNFLMSFDPELPDKDILSAVKNAFSKMVTYINNDCEGTKNCLAIIDSLLSKVSVDFNEFMNNNYSTFIAFVINTGNLKLLDIYEKHGADFSDCPLCFDTMVTNSSLPIFDYLKNHGCKFENALIRNKFFEITKTKKSPLQCMMPNFVFEKDLCIETLLFILDFSTPKQIKNANFHHHNLIDIFMKYSSQEGILKAYMLSKKVFYPLSMSVDDYDKWIKQTNNKELMNIFFNSKTYLKNK